MAVSIALSIVGLPWLSSVWIQECICDPSADDYSIVFWVYLIGPYWFPIVSGRCSSNPIVRLIDLRNFISYLSFLILKQHNCRSLLVSLTSCLKINKISSHDILTRCNSFLLTAKLIKPARSSLYICLI